MNMKKIFSFLFLSLLLAWSVCGASFVRTRTYAGQFIDVPDDAWYASDVAAAYELGFVSGKSDVEMDPDGSVTVAEAITMASRMHAIFAGSTVPGNSTDGNWYDSYVAYASANGIIAEGDFAVFDRPILRGEMAKLFAAALPKEQYAAVNDVSAVPDVDASEPYAEDLLMLYRAGVVMGSDLYGNFLPNTRIKRCEAAAIICRAALPEKRLHRELLPEEEKREAVVLIDNHTLNNTVGGVAGLASGWNYDDRSAGSVNTTGATTNVLADSSRTGFVAINRAFETRSTGRLTLVTTFTLAGSANNGAHIFFSDSLGTPVLDVTAIDGVWAVNGISAGIAAPQGATGLILDIDLDAKTGSITNETGTAAFTFGDFADFSRITYATSDAGVFTFTPQSCRLFANYAVCETFASGVPQNGWTISGAAVETNAAVSIYDSHYLRFTENGSAVRAFDPVSGRFTAEAYFRMPDDASSAVISLSGANAEVLSVSLAGGILHAGTLSLPVKSHLWHILHIEGDTAAGSADLYVNGKKLGALSLQGAAVDAFSVDYTGGENGGCFDNIKVYRTYDYADYVPEVEKVESPDYTLIMSVCSLWHEGSHYGWDYVAPWDETTPLLGYYDEGLPEVSDWNVKFMAEHGIDAEQYCWYTPSAASAEPIEQPRLYHDLHEGYFYGKYSDAVKFCILWENSNYSTAKMTLETFKTMLWDYWVTYYFTDPRYLTVDNVVIFEIYEPSYFASTFGDEAKAVIDFMHEDIKNYGFDGIAVLFHNRAQTEDVPKLIASIGGDGIMPYAWPSDYYMPETLREVNAKALENVKKYEGLTFIPTVTAGRNGMGWADTRTPMSTVAQHEEILRDTKDVLAAQNGTEAWQKQLIYFSTWNEYAEGHWLAPSGLNGFGYADAWRKVFTNDASEHADVVPTLKQKDRISHLYNDERTPIRREWLDTVGGYDIPSVNVLHFDFSDGSFKNTDWLKIRIAGFEIRDGKLHITTTESDSIFRYEHDLNLNASDVAYIRVRMRTTAKSNMQIYFITPEDTAWTGDKGVSQSISAGDEFTDVLFDMRKCARWKGVIKRVRFDPTDEVAVTEIESIDFLGYTEAEKPVEIVVDGVSLSIQKEYEEDKADEFYVAGYPRIGIFSALNLYPQWDRKTGVLTLVNAAGRTVVFTVGSAEARVDGVPVALARPVWKYDGLPMLPLKFLCGQMGIGYAREGKRIELDVRGVNYAEILEARKNYEWEFNIPGDTEGWTGISASLGVSGGEAVLMPARVASNRITGYDPIMHIKGIGFAAKDYTGIEIRMRYTLYPNIGDAMDDQISVYFATAADSALNEAKSFKVKLADAVPDGDYFIFRADTTKNDLWTGTVSQLRFDPTNNNGEYCVDYIRLIPGDNRNALKGAKTSVTPKTVPSILPENAEPLLAYEFASAAEESRFIYYFIDSHTVKDGVLTIKPQVEKGDPQMYAAWNVPLLENAANYDVVTMRLRPAEGFSGVSNLFFKTEGMSGYSAALVAQKKLSDCSLDADGWFTVEYDLAANPAWDGAIAGLRFDVIEGAVPVEIDYIRFYKKSGAQDSSGSEEKQTAPTAVTLAAKAVGDHDGASAIYAFSFDDKDGIKGLSPNNHGELGYKDGHLVYTSKEGDRDPQLALYTIPQELDNALCFDTVVLRVASEKPLEGRATLFFRTNTMSGFDAAHAAAVSIDKPDADGYYTIVIDMTVCDKYEGTFTALRLDPADIETVYYFDSIAFYKCK